MRGVDWDRVADDDGVVGDQHFLDQQANDALALVDVEGLGTGEQAGEEGGQALGQAQGGSIRSAVWSAMARKCAVAPCSRRRSSSSDSRSS